MKTLFARLLPVLVLAAGVTTFVALLKTRPHALSAPQRTEAPPVDVIVIAPGDHVALVRGHGSVVPAERIGLVPEVAGRVVFVNPSLVPGGRVTTGEVLLRIDARDYALAADQQVAQVERARLELSIEAARKVVAEREWQLLAAGDATTTTTTSVTTTPDVDPARRAVALREPHVAAARAAVAAAESGLERARLALARTTLRAPFDAVVLQESVDVGQVVAPGAPLATLAGTARAFVQVALPAADLAWFPLPGPDGRGGAAARVVTGDRAARVVRLLGDVEPAGRLARVLVEVDAPLDGAPPLLYGSYVEVVIAGRVLPASYDLPRAALRDGGRVWVMDAAGRLGSRAVTVRFARADTVLAEAALAPGDRIIVGEVATPVDGMAVRLRHDEVRP